MGDVLYLIGIDPRANPQINPVPAMFSQFDGAPVFACADYVRGIIAAGQVCRLRTDADGFDKVARMLLELRDA